MGKPWATSSALLEESWKGLPELGLSDVAWIRGWRWLGWWLGGMRWGWPMARRKRLAGGQPSMWPEEERPVVQRWSRWRKVTGVRVLVEQVAARRRRSRSPRAWHGCARPRRVPNDDRQCRRLWVVMQGRQVVGKSTGMGMGFRSGWDFTRGGGKVAGTVRGQWWGRWPPKDAMLVMMEGRLAGEMVVSGVVGCRWHGNNGGRERVQWPVAWGGVVADDRSGWGLTEDGSPEGFA